MPILYRVIDDKRSCLSSLYSSLISLFCNKILIKKIKHAFLASKQGLSCLLKTPFLGLTNAFLEPS